MDFHNSFNVLSMLDSLFTTTEKFRRRPDFLFLTEIHSHTRVFVRMDDLTASVLLRRRRSATKVRLERNPFFSFHTPTPHTINMSVGKDDHLPRRLPRTALCKVRQPSNTRDGRAQSPNSRHRQCLTFACCKLCHVGGAAARQSGLQIICAFNFMGAIFLLSIFFQNDNPKRSEATWRDVCLFLNLWTVHFKIRTCSNFSHSRARKRKRPHST